MRKVLRSPVFWVVLALVSLAVASTFLGGGDEPQKLRLSQFQRLVADGRVRSAQVVGEDKVKGELADGTRYEAKFPAEYADELTTRLLEGRVEVDSKDAKENVWLSLAVNFLPIVLLFGGFLFIVNSMQGGGNKVMQFGKAKPKVVSKEEPKVTFADVAGADEAVNELVEIKEFLESPAKF